MLEKLRIDRGEAVWYDIHVGRPVGRSIFRVGATFTVAHRYDQGDPRGRPYAHIAMKTRLLQQPGPFVFWGDQISFAAL